MLEGEHTYPVRLNQKRVEEEDGWWEREKGRRVKGRKDRMKRERRPDQTQAVRADTKGGNIDTFRSLDDEKRYLDDLSTFTVSEMKL